MATSGRAAAVLESNQNAWDGGTVLLNPGMEPPPTACQHEFMPARVVSREPEASAITDFLASSAAAPSALVLEGEPGIGKTTV